MKKNHQKTSLLLFLFLYLGMTLLIAGCGDNKQAESLTTMQDIKVLTMFNEDLNPDDDNFSSPVAKAITEASGVKLEIEYPVGDVAKKLGIMIASGDYADFLMVKDTAQLVDAGAYIDLAPLIEKYAPNIKKLYGDQINRLRYSTDNPAIYIIPTTAVGGERLAPAMGFQLQHAVVKALNYPKLETIYDFEEVIENYINKYPTINGEPTIGITLCTDDWRWVITLGNPAGFATGLPDDGNWYINPETYEATYRFLRPEEKEYFRWLNHMYDKGLIDPDSFVQKYDAYIAKIASGRVLGLIDAYWQYASGQQVLRTEGKFDRTYGQYPLQMTKETKAADFRDTGYLGGYGIGISVNCEEPVEAIKFLDFMASDEGQVLRHWGIEGVNYELVDGKRIRTAEEQANRSNDVSYKKKTGVGAYVYPFPTWGNGVLDPSGNPYSADTADSIVVDYSMVEKQVLKAYGVERWAELYPSADDLYRSEWGSAWMIPIPSETGITPILDRCDAIMKQLLIEAIISPPEDFDAIWDRGMGLLEDAGVYEINKAFTELVKDRVALWQPDK